MSKPNAIHDHIFTKPLWALSLFPTYPIPHLPSFYYHSHTHSHTHSLIHSHTRSFTHTHSLIHSHTLAHTITDSLTHSFTHTHTHTLTRSFTRTHTHSFIHSHTHSLTHTINHSLTHLKVKKEKKWEVSPVVQQTFLFSAGFKATQERLVWSNFESDFQQFSLLGFEANNAEIESINLYWQVLSSCRTVIWMQRRKDEMNRTILQATTEKCVG